MEMEENMGLDDPPSPLNIGEHKRKEKFEI